MVGYGLNERSNSFNKYSASVKCEDILYKSLKRRRGNLSEEKTVNRTIFVSSDRNNRRYNSVLYK